MDISLQGLAGEERLQLLLSGIPDVITLVSPEGAFMYVSPSCINMFGFKPSEMEGRNAYDFVHPEDALHLASETEKLVMSGAPGKVLFRALKKDGSYLWVEATGRAIRNMSGELVEIQSCVRDISERRDYEQRLEKTNRELLQQVKINEAYKTQLHLEGNFRESIIKYSPIGIVALDTELNITEWNPAIEAITGRPRKDVLGRNWLDMYPGVHDTEDHANFLRVLGGETIFIPEKKFYGREGYHSTYLTPLRDREGQTIGMVTLVNDISDRKKIEESLRENENFLKQVTDSSPNIIYVYDVIEKKQVYVNRELTNLLGYTPGDIDGDLRAFMASKVHPDDSGIVINRFNKFETATEGEIVEDEYRMMDKKGAWRWINSRAVVFKRNAEGKVWQVIGNSTDVTARKEAEQTLVQLHNTKALLHKKDEFISIASHELKTPLTSVRAYMQLLQQSFSEISEENKKQYIDRAAIHIEKLNKLVEDLLDISRMQAGKMVYTMTEFSADEWIIDCIENHQRISAMHIIQKEGATGKRIFGDRQRLEQVLSNLLSNAIKYSPGAGKVSVKVDTEGNLVRISVTDYGIGIPQDKQPYVFDRFYRVEDTPSYIQGLGIGLYISKEIITRHGGSITVESEEGKGTTFSFTLQAAG